MDEEKKNEQEEIVEEASEVVDEPEKADFDFPWRGFIIVFGILTALIVTCVIVILLNGGFYQW